MDKMTELDRCKLEGFKSYILELYCANKLFNGFIKNKYSIITELFMGIENSITQCPDCNYHSYNMQPNMMLGLDIPQTKPNSINQDMANELQEHIEKKLERIQHIKNISPENYEKIKSHIINNSMSDLLSNKKYNFYDCLDISYSEPEILSDGNEWFCENCNCKVKAYKKNMIWMPPKILVIYFKRYENLGATTIKKGNLIDFPINGLDINKYISKTYYNFNAIYDLYAVSNQMGNLNGGHYYTYAKNSIDNQWYEYDDDKITKLNEDNIVTNNAYILFYKRKD